MDTDTRRALVSFRIAYTLRKPQPTCLTETDVKRSNDSMEITLPYTLAGYSSQPSSIMETPSFALENERFARLLRLCPDST
jgi:hypothetical protein